MQYAKVDKLQVFVAESRAQMGVISGQDVAMMLKVLLEEKDELNVMFAAAPSQNDVLAELISDRDIDWTRINGFHMDEYIGLSADAPQGFGNFLRERIFGKLPFKHVYYIDIAAKDPQAEADRYEQILKDHPMDVCILGVGENGHVAFNDPGEAKFDDERLVKTVQLDERCRQQQVNDGCFATIDDVPKTAMTVTIPGLCRAKAMFCVVPTTNKAEAIGRMLCGEIDELCPASILRRKNGARLYLDPAAASQISIEEGKVYEAR